MPEAVPATAAPLAITGAPIVLSASEQGEPTMEELAALLPATEPEVTEDPVVPAATEPTAEETAPTEPVPAVEEKPAQPEADAALERASKAAARAREGSRRYAETQRQIAEQAAHIAQQTAQTQRAARDAQQYRQEVEAARERDAQLKKDPYKALKQLGMTDEELARRAMQENSPEAATHRLEAQLAEERSARVALEQRLDNERAEAHRAAMSRQAEASFVAEAADAAAYPELAIRSPAKQLAAARAALAQIRANGHETRHFSDAQVAQAANLWLSPDAKPAAAPAPAAAPPQARPGIAKPSGKTLTNAQAQTRVVAPADWHTLSEEQQIAHIAASLPEPT